MEDETRCAPSFVAFGFQVLQIGDGIGRIIGKSSSCLDYASVSRRLTLAFEFAHWNWSALSKLGGVKAGGRLGDRTEPNAALGSCLS